MRFLHVILTVAIILLSTVLFAQSTQKNGGVVLRFQHVVAGKTLDLNSTVYTNESGDSFMVGVYKYYVSNITLVNDDGETGVEDDSYHLVNEAKPSSKEFIVNIPGGEYTAIQFLIGVDSLHNVSGAQSGALDPINAMFWDWNTGYIMAKLEGVTMPGHKEFSYHIGGFAGATNTVRPVTLKLPKPVTVKEGRRPLITIQSEIGEWFKTPGTLSIAKSPVVTLESKEAAAIADNYTDMFSVYHVEE